MNENVNGLKKVDVFNDVVSRLEDSKKARVSDDVVSGMKNYYNNKQDYRERVNILAENLNGVKPIDNLVNNVIYLSNFVEKGIAIKTSIISFKQIWIEYRLIFNEKNVKQEEIGFYNNSVNNELNNSNNNIESNQLNINNDNLLGNNEFNKFEAPAYDTGFNINNNVVDNKTNNEFNLNNNTANNEFKLPDFGLSTSSFDDIANNINSFSNSVSSNDLNSNLSFDMPSINNIEYKSDNLNTFDNKLDDNYNRLYNKVNSLSRYIEDFNNRKLELDRQIATLEERKRSLSNELRELEMAKKEFSRYKLEEEKKINDMKNEVNSRVVSLQNLIDNLDNILGNIN